MNTIAAIIVTFNRKDMLLQCIQKILNQSVACDILVVDNASTDDTFQTVTDLQNPAVHIWHSEKNMGGAGGFNYGMRWAVELGYSYLWIMDDDTMPNQDALEELCRAKDLTKDQFAFLSSEVLWTDGSACKMNCQMATPDYHRYFDYLGEGLLEIWQATFVSLFFPAAVVRQMGLPYKEFFIWGDDIEYTHRLYLKSGLPCFLVGKSRVVHAMKANTGSDIALDNSERISRYWYSCRNENFTYRSQYGIPGFFSYLKRWMKKLAKIWLLGKDHKWKRTATLFSGMWSGFFFNPPIEYI